MACPILCSLNVRHACRDKGVYGGKWWGMGHSMWQHGGKRMSGWEVMLGGGKRRWQGGGGAGK